jgi:ankyrin repeat protein
MKRQNIRYDRIISRIKNNPIAACVIVLGTIVIALLAFTGAARNLLSLMTKKRPEAARMGLSQMSLEYTTEAFVRSAEKGDITAVDLFLAAGMDANVTDKEGNTALMYEAAKGHTPILDALLKAQADVNKKNMGGRTALSWAASAGQTDSLRILLDKGANAEAINEAFISAACMGQLEVLRILFDRGADVNKVGSNALRCAAASTRVGVTEEERNDTVSFILDLGSDVNAQNEDGWTALLSATERGLESVVRTLLNRGADVNAACDCPGFRGGGWSPLTIAALRGHTGIVRALLDKGADVNAKSGDQGRTPLIVAVLGGYTDIVRALLERGADINEKDNSGKTALELAEERLQGERGAKILQMLKEAEPK